MDYKGKSVLILLKDKTILPHKIEEEPIAHGGEGIIYRIQYKVEENTTTYILKLYSSPGKAAKNFAKVKCMFNHPIQSSNANVRFCWPIGLVYDKRTTQFYGFAMEEAFCGSRNLEILSTYYINSTIAERFPDDKGWHRIYELKTNMGLRNRLVILYKWAVAIKELQEKGNIVMGDIKPSNVMCTADGKISIVDIDSMQYTYKRYNPKEEKCEKHTFSSAAHSPEFCHPDVQNNKAKLFNLPPSFDVFSMAVSFYMVLTGTHPYANVINLPPYDDDKYQKLSAMIKSDLYLRSEKGQKYLRTIESYNLHSNFERLSDNLKELFNRTFTSKLEDEPTMNEWCLAIKKEINKIEKNGEKQLCIL